MNSSMSRYYLLAGAVAIVIFPVVLFAAIGDSSGKGAASGLALAQGGGGELRPDAPIPPQYVDWVVRAGHLCPEITPALIAAQIDQESGWNKDAVAHNPPANGGDAMGISQFQQATWNTWGADYDGDGTASPYDPEDAIMAQGRLMCDNIEWAKGKVGAGKISGDLIDLALAAYNCGRGCVETSGGVPASGQAHDYPILIRGKLSKYAAAAPPAVVGGWTLPLAKGTYEIVSGFGPRAGGYHYGLDWAANKNIPIFSVAAGVVLNVICNASNSCDQDGSASVSGCGWYVEILHPGDIVTRYCHQIRRPPLQVGQTVTAGTQIGWIGTSGNSSGPHLHFEVHRGKPATNSNAVDPLAFLRSAGLQP